VSIDQWKTRVLKGVGNPSSILNFDELECFFEAEVVAGFAAETFATGAGAFEGVEGKVAG
jgi:hypothetical protein